MQVYRNFELAKSEMIRMSQKHKAVVSLLYTVYGNNPYKLEFKLCLKSELVCDPIPSNCMCDYVNGFGYIDVQSLEDVESKLGGNVQHSITSSHRCGDEPLKGSTNSLEEIHLKNTDYE